MMAMHGNKAYTLFPAERSYLVQNYLLSKAVSHSISLDQEDLFVMHLNISGETRSQVKPSPQVRMHIMAEIFQN